MKTIPVVAAAKPPKPEEYYKEVGVRLFWVLVIANFLGAYGSSEDGIAMMEWLFDHTIVPIFELTLHIVFEMMGGAQCLGESILETNAGNISQTNQLFSVHIKDSILCLISQINILLMSGNAGGFGLITAENAGLLDLIAGLWLIMTFTVLQLFYALFLVDALFEIGLSMMLMPLFLVAWVFPYTRKKIFVPGIKIALDGIAIFFMTCIMISVLYHVLMYVGEAYFSDPRLFSPFFNFSSIYTDPSLSLSASANFDPTRALIENNKLDKFSGVILLIALGLICAMLSGNVMTYAKQLFDTERIKGFGSGADHMMGSLGGMGFDMIKGAMNKYKSKIK